MSRFNFTNGNLFWSALSQKAMRTPKEMSERKRLSALLRDAKRKLKKEKPKK